MSGQAAVVPDHVPADRVVDLDIYALPNQDAGLHKAWAEIQAQHPELIWTPRNEGHWIATRGDVLREVQGDHERFSNRVIVLPKSVGEHHALIPTTIDPPEHKPYRRLLNDALALGKVRGLEEAIREAATDLVDGFAGDGYCNFTEQYAEVFPIRIFLKLVDLPEEDSPRVRHWAHCMTRPGMDMAFEDARAAFYEYLDPVIRARREQGGNDMISAMLENDMGGRQLSHEEALSLVTQVLIAGLDTVVNFLGFAITELARNAGVRARFIAEPALILPAANEFFRRYSTVTVAREVREDMEYRGVNLRAGDMIAVPTAVHGIDPAVNDDPLTIDVDRRGGRHSAFGNGPHMCPGQELARREVAITIEEWLKRIPDFRIAEDSDLSVIGGIAPSLTRVCLAWDSEAQGEDQR